MIQLTHSLLKTVHEYCLEHVQQGNAPFTRNDFFTVATSSLEFAVIEEHRLFSSGLKSYQVALPLKIYLFHLNNF